MNPTILVIIIAAAAISGLAAIYFFRLKKRQLIKFTVDYAKNVEQAIADCKFHFVNVDINAKNFPISSETIGKKVDIAGKLFRGFDNSKDAIRKMDKEGFRPGTLLELLAISIAHPELQERFSIIALGSSSFDSRRVPYIYVSGYARELHLHYFSDAWSVKYCFLGVCK